MHKQREKPYNDSDLDRLTPTECAVLRAYYETDRTWEQVADMLHYSAPRVFQIRRIAIEKIRNIQIVEHSHKETGENA